jgi:hypothetical protein
MLIWDTLVNGIDLFLISLGVDPDLTIARVATVLLAVKIVLIFCLMNLAVFGRLRRRWLRRNDEVRGAQLRGLILDYLAGDSDTKKKEVLRTILHSVSGRMEYGFFRRLLQDQIKRVQGQEFDLLVQLYKEAGFFAQDLQDLDSWAWWTRLSAAIRLERLKDDSLALIFKDLMADKNELIALVAIRAYSKMKGDTELLLEFASRLAPARKDIFIEILLSISTRDKTKLVEYLVNCYDPYIAALCIFALGRLKEASAVPTLISLTTSSSDEVVEAAVDALSKIGDARALPSIRGLLHHPQNIIRAKALGALLAFGEDSIESLERELKADNSVEMKRALFNGRLMAPIKGRFS